MRKLFITMLLFFNISILSFSQINVSIENDCLKHNSALISKAMIETFGEDSIRFLLNNDFHFVFTAKVDSLGNILKIEKVRSKWTITDSFVTSIETNLIKNKVCFYICYAHVPLDIPKEHIIDYAREHFKKENWKYISFGFPGELMSLYEYEKLKAKEEGVCLSKYEYFLKQIKRFFPN